MVRTEPHAQVAEDLELIIQFGYLALFGASFPLGFALAAVTNLLDLRNDLSKLLFMYRRVPPKQVHAADCPRERRCALVARARLLRPMFVRWVLG